MIRKFFSWLRKPLPNVVYMEMRGQMFRLNPEKVGIKRANDHTKAWGVMTEFTIDDGYVTMVSLANGRTYMYFSSGSGILGAGDYSMVSIASAARPPDQALRFGDFRLCEWRLVLFRHRARG